MNSSISSSDPGTPGPAAPVGIVLRTWGRTAAVFVLLILGAEMWHRADPVVHPTDLDLALLETQFRRAVEGPAADLVLIGDSTSLMDLDARAAARALGSYRVESLATTAWVSPTGYAALLRRYREIKGDPGHIVILMNGTSVDADSTRAEFERMAIAGRLIHPGPFLVGARRKIYDLTIGRLVPWPLPGRYGLHYGWPTDLERALDDENGTMLDPSTPLSDCGHAAKGTFRYSLDAGMASRLSVLGEAVATLGPDRVSFAFTPLPASRSNQDTVKTRRETTNEVLAALGLPDRSGLDVADTLPDELFTCPGTYLTDEGRKALTTLFAEQMKRRMGERR